MVSRVPDIETCCPPVPVLVPWTSHDDEQGWVYRGVGSMHVRPVKMAIYSARERR